MRHLGMAGAERRGQFERRLPDDQGAMAGGAAPWRLTRRGVARKGIGSGPAARGIRRGRRPRSRRGRFIRPPRSRQHRDVASLARRERPARGPGVLGRRPLRSGPQGSQPDIAVIAGAIGRCFRGRALEGTSVLPSSRALAVPEIRYANRVRGPLPSPSVWFQPIGRQWVFPPLSPT